jgi:hypothetical protein
MTDRQKMMKWKLYKQIDQERAILKDMKSDYRETPETIADQEEHIRFLINSEAIIYNFE